MEYGSDLHLYLRFHRQWREFQKLNGFIGRAYGGQKTPASETHLMLELEGRGPASARQLAESLQMPVTSLARAVHSLLKSGYIEVLKSEEHARGRVIALSRLGAKFMKSHHSRNEAQIGRLSSRLGEAQLRQLTSYFHELADGLGESQSVLVGVISPFRREIIRLTRAHGLMRKKAFAWSDLNFLQWHILAAVTRDMPGASVQDLCELFSVPINTMAAAVSALVKGGLLSRQTDARDKRRGSLSATDAGGKLVDHIERQDAQRYKSALRNLAATQLRELDALWSSLVNWAPAEGESIMLQQRITATPLQDDSAIKEARRYLLQEYSKSPPLEPSGHLLHPSSDSYALYAEDKIIAVLELWPLGDRSRTLGNLVASDSAKVSTLREFILGSVSHKLAQVPDTSIRIDTAALALCRRVGVPIKQSSDGFRLDMGAGGK